jgi:hypothetical protein
MPAAHIAELLASRGVQLEMIIDEGIGLAVRGIAPFTQQPVVLVGTAEKQRQSVQVRELCALLQCRHLVLMTYMQHAVTRKLDA